MYNWQIDLYFYDVKSSFAQYNLIFRRDKSLFAHFLYFGKGRMQFAPIMLYFYNIFLIFRRGKSSFTQYYLY